MEKKFCSDKETRFYKEIKMSSELDFRDTQRKRHDLKIVLMGVTLAMLCKRDGNLLSIHRRMKHHFLGKPCVKRRV
jgi:hypothetical protein